MTNTREYIGGEGGETELEFFVFEDVKPSEENRYEDLKYLFRHSEYYGGWYGEK